ncbi:uncharacterized protein LOC144748708 [Ciona intestinalis]
MWSNSYNFILFITADQLKDDINPSLKLGDAQQDDSVEPTVVVPDEMAPVDKPNDDTKPSDESKEPIPESGKGSFGFNPSWGLKLPDFLSGKSDQLEDDINPSIKLGDAQQDDVVEPTVVVPDEMAPVDKPNDDTKPSDESKEPTPESGKGSFGFNPSWNLKLPGFLSGKSDDPKHDSSPTEQDELPDKSDLKSGEQSPSFKLDGDLDMAVKDAVIIDTPDSPNPKSAKGSFKFDFDGVNIPNKDIPNRNNSVEPTSPTFKLGAGLEVPQSDVETKPEDTAVDVEIPG